MPGPLSDTVTSGFRTTISIRAGLACDCRAQYSLLRIRLSKTCVIRPGLASDREIALSPYRHLELGCLPATTVVFSYVPNKLTDSDLCPSIPRVAE